MCQVSEVWTLFVSGNALLRSSLEVQGANIAKKLNHAVLYLFGSVTLIQTGTSMSIYVVLACYWWLSPNKLFTNSYNINASIKKSLACFLAVLLTQGGGCKLKIWQTNLIRTRTSAFCLQAFQIIFVALSGLYLQSNKLCSSLVLSQ